MVVFLNTSADVPWFWAEIFHALLLTRTQILWPEMGLLITPSEKLQEIILEYLEGQYTLDRLENTLVEISNQIGPVATHRIYIWAYETYNRKEAWEYHDQFGDWMYIMGLVTRQESIDLPHKGKLSKLVEERRREKVRISTKLDALRQYPPADKCEEYIYANQTPGTSPLDWFHVEFSYRLNLKYVLKMMDEFDIPFLSTFHEWVADMDKLLEG